MPANQIYTQEELKSLHYIIAPWLIGCFLDLLTQGIILCQLNNYRNWYRDDKPLLKIMVYVLVLLATLKCIDSCAVVWVSLITYFGDIAGSAMLNYTTWWQSGVPLMGACINFYAQIYFLYRLFAISNHHWSVYPIGFVLAFAWLSIVIGTINIKFQNLSEITRWFAAHLGATFAGDILISCSTAYFLLNKRRNSLKQTQSLIDTLVRVTWQSAMPAALCATLNLILSQAFKNYIISTIPNQLLPKLYAIAMLWTINSRKAIRMVASNSGKTSSSEGVSVGRTRRTGDNVELGRITVHKQVETISHVEWERRTSDDIKNGGIYGRQPATITIQEEDASQKQVQVV